MLRLYRSTRRKKIGTDSGGARHPDGWKRKLYPLPNHLNFPVNGLTPKYFVPIFTPTALAPYRECGAKRANKTHADSTVGHVVEVTAKRRLFFGLLSIAPRYVPD